MHLEDLVAPGAGASSSRSSGAAPMSIAGLDEHMQKDFFKVMDMMLLSGDTLKERPSVREAEELVTIVLEMCAIDLSEIYSLERFKALRMGLSPDVAADVVTGWDLSLATERQRC
eukprot:7141410-Heterocapsa_arctica.AAC.1